MGVAIQLLVVMVTLITLSTLKPCPCHVPHLMQQTTSALFQLHIKYDEILLAQLKKKKASSRSVLLAS